MRIAFAPIGRHEMQPFTPAVEITENPPRAGLPFWPRRSCSSAIRLVTDAFDVTLWDEITPVMPAPTPTPAPQPLDPPVANAVPDLDVG